MCAKKQSQTRSGIDTEYSNLNNYEDISDSITVNAGTLYSAFRIGKLVILNVRYDGYSSITVLSGIPTVITNLHQESQAGDSYGVFYAKAGGTALYYDDAGGISGAKRTIITYVTND